VRRRDFDPRFWHASPAEFSVRRFYAVGPKLAKKSSSHEMLNFNRPLIFEGKSKVVNDSKTRSSNYKSAALSAGLRAQTGENM
jgi:hypothetical protein